MRGKKTDLMQAFRFHVTAFSGDIGGDPLQPKYQIDREGFETQGVAGFNNVTTPEVSIEPAEYREGIMTWTQKYPGPPTVSDITLSQGVMKRNTAFFDMVMIGIEGGHYRSDVTIYHFDRDKMERAVRAEVGDDLLRIECGECFATRAKQIGDLDATSGEVLLGEVDLAVEKFSIKYE